ncbi:FxsB family cyclophane-forming radical SAM/SPASM peptide maturase [Streptomyces sp. NBC_01803]|uniref:FxsB family cyclophane-forming radical SAM/SPASM peptide maturase n=1 Tax=Streptomyces sp. NBC_01803 TaxID=2975946 RepID=UPI002DDAD234|nr:FxsB family cyclophane-forming radical SAM/SPASM peptide maturase [Streptomyces sp. NBC_01803]WSA44242.1 FxsB family radical SAM/SPASM domain protein [Streptomyces sp. NBC_01803]
MDDSASIALPPSTVERWRARTKRVRWQMPTFDSATAPARPWPEGGRRQATARAFDQFVVKLHSRCNLACDYCYVYELRDSGWRDRPRVMSAATLDSLVRRIAEHARRHGLSTVRVILHGGEPLLAGVGVISRLAEATREAMRGAGATAQLVIQSNGLLLDRPLLDELARHDIGVGLSLDGDRAAQDRHRRRADGRGSHADVLRALELLHRPEYQRLFEGLLCTVDLANDPAATCRALADHRPPMADLLLPHGTWDHPPPGHVAGEARYGAWLSAAFDRWWADGRPFRLRLFDAITDLLLAGSSGSEVVGLLAADAVVIETDGSIEWADSLKAVADGAAATGLNVREHSFDAVLALPRRPVSGIESLCRTCRACPVGRVCGGGLRAHRYGRHRGFDNPSVYCLDLALLISHIRHRLADTVSDTPSVPLDPSISFG